MVIALKAAVMAWIWRRFPDCRESTLFDPDFYLKTYPDVAAAGLCPYRHFLQYGVAEGRSPAPFFDTAFYLGQTEDRPIDPARHYLLTGASLELRPHPHFNAQWYLLAYPDVAEAGVNPFKHFITHGRQEGRVPQPAFGNALRVDQIVHWKRSSTAPSITLRLGGQSPPHHATTFSADFGFVVDASPRQRDAILGLFAHRESDRDATLTLDVDASLMERMSTVFLRFRSCHWIKDHKSLAMNYDEALIFDLVEGKLCLNRAFPAATISIALQE